MDLDLEQGPGDIEDHLAVPGPQVGRDRQCPIEVAPLELGLEQVPGGELAQRFNERVEKLDHRGECRAGPDGSVVDGVAGLMEELAQIGDPGSNVRAEDPLLTARPAGFCLSRKVDVERKRDGNRTPARPRGQVVDDPERGRVGAE